MTLCIVGFDDLVTSFVATIATGWSDPCRVGLSPTEKPRLTTAHWKSRLSKVKRRTPAAHPTTSNPGAVMRRHDGIATRPCIQTQGCRYGICYGVVR
jgi:hypothetical protein